MGMQSIKLGDTDVIVAGGQESMSQAPHCAHLRNGQKMGDLSFIDTMIRTVCGTLSTAITWATRPRTSPRNIR